MGVRIIFIIQSDPEKSHRPAEAIRITAGLAASNVPVKIILSGRASLLLSHEEEEDIVDSEIVEKFMPLLRDWKIPIYIDKTCATEITTKEYNLRFVDLDEISEILPDGYCMVF